MKSKTYIVLLLGVAALSTSAIFVKLADAPSSVTAFYRLFFTALILLPFLFCNRKNREELCALGAKQISYVILSGILLAIHYVMWFESLRYTSVSSSTVLVSLQPLFSILWGLLFLQERIKLGAFAGCLIAILGCVVIGWGDFQVSKTALFGDALALVAAGVISLYFLIGQVVRKHTGVIPYSVLSYLSSSAFLLIYTLLGGYKLWGYPVTTWGAFCGLSLISTIGGQFVFNLLLKKVSATAVTMSILGEPVGTCILAYFILKETIVARQFAGIVMILLGLSIYFLYPIICEKRGIH